MKEMRNVRVGGRGGTYNPGMSINLTPRFLSTPRTTGSSHNATMSSLQAASTVVGLSAAPSFVPGRLFFELAGRR